MIVICLSRQSNPFPLAGEGGGARRFRPRSGRNGAGGRVRVAVRSRPFAPQAGGATLTPTLSRQREREIGGAP